jgi:hypothetical protein
VTAGQHSRITGNQGDANQFSIHQRPPRAGFFVAILTRLHALYTPTMENKPNLTI